MPRFSKKIGCCLLLAGLLFSVRPALAVDSQTSLDKGVIQYQRENYDEALGLLKAAKQEDPQSTRVSYYLGLTYKKMEDYKQSQLFLTEAVEGSPKIKEALLELIEVCYQLDDVESAKKWIALAEEQGMRPGQTKFVKGLVLVKDGKSAEAIQAFKEAKELEPALKQNANFQIGLVHLKDKSYGEASKSFQEVILLDPNTEIGRYAEEYKKNLDQRRRATKPLNMTAGIFEEYDDNVVLKPNDDLATVGINQSKDWREVFTFSADLNKKFNEFVGGAVQYNLYHTLQNEQHAFSLSSHTVGAVPSLYAGGNVYSVPVQYNYTYVDGNDFVSTISVNPLANIKLAENQLGQFGVKYESKNYIAAATSAVEDRDAYRWAPGVGWFYFFQENKAFVNLRYEFDSENTTGRNWDYQGHHVSAATQWPVLEKWKLTLSADAYWQGYQNTHSSFNVKRTDENYTLSAGVSYPVTEQMDWQLRLMHVEHVSNIDVYAYTRDVISTGLTVKF